MVMFAASELPSSIRLLTFCLPFRFFGNSICGKGQYSVSIVYSEQQTQLKKAKTLVLTQIGELVHYTEFTNIFLLFDLRCDTPNREGEI